MAKRDNVKIQHALNSGEYKILRVGKLDGFCEKTNTVYKFQGCYHGDTEKRKVNTTMDNLHKNTQKKNKKITSLGYNLVEMWKSQFKADKKISEWLKTSDLEVVTPLVPCDALYGCCTNVIKLKVKCPKGWKIRYKDIISLSPFIDRTG